MDDEQIYFQLIRKDKCYEKNMPKPQAMMFLTLFKDEEWTWSGLAELLLAKYGEGDVDELIACIKMARA